MKHLPNFYGVDNALGILTNMNDWRIAWLPKDETDQILVAAQTEAIIDETLDQQESDEGELQETSQSSESVGAHQIVEEEFDEEESLATVKHPVID